jgi:hypothetical protein
MEANAAKGMQLAIAFERALDILGDPSKKVLLNYLKHSNISLEQDIDLRQIESTLRDFIGLGADLIMERVRENSLSAKAGGLSK